MLYFQTKPDPVFSAVLHHSLEMEVHEIARISKEKDFDTWSAGYAQMSQVFTPYTALVTLEQLFAASQEPIVYRLTDPHWLLVYECLKNYCAVHNDLLRDERGKGLAVGRYHLREIDFDHIAELYFWDSDFLFLPQREEMSKESSEWQGPDINEPIDLTTDICPLPTQLTLTPVKEPAWRVPDEYEYFGPASIRYPDGS